MLAFLDFIFSVLPNVKTYMPSIVPRRPTTNNNSRLLSDIYTVVTASTGSFMQILYKEE